MLEFLGFKREDSQVGIRNHLLILPVQKVLNPLVKPILDHVPGCRGLITPGEWGRRKKDVETIARTMRGLALNGNVGGVLLLGDSRLASSVLNHQALAQELQERGRPVALVELTESGGYYGAVGEGIRQAQRLLRTISSNRRSSCPLGDLQLGVKCGASDPTSAIAGNPVVGGLFDLLIFAGGGAIFSETTELIGAEASLAKRCVSPEVQRALLAAVKRVEEKGISVGENIREINPVRENILGGLTTLEEKSLGAVRKSGTRPIKGVLEYGQIPHEKGLYFMDAWMSCYSLPLGNASAGVQLFLYQMGGEGLPAGCPAPAVSTGVVTPILYVTGNPRTMAQNPEIMDFSSGDLMEGRSSLEEMVERLLEMVLDVASGTLVKSETVQQHDPVELYLEGPVF